MAIFGKKVGNLTFFQKKNAFLLSLITQKLFIFEHSYVSYGKRQKSCTLIVIFVILSDFLFVGYFICRGGRNFRKNAYNHSTVI